MSDNEETNGLPAEAADETLREGPLPSDQEIGEGRYSNLPPAFVDGEHDLASLSAEDVKTLLVRLELDRKDEMEAAARSASAPPVPPAPPEPQAPPEPAPRPQQPYDPAALAARYDASSPASRERSGGMLDFIQSIIIALLLAVFIRIFVFEAFKIPSRSMEPTLIGDESYGDHVAVNKLAYRLGKPHRWDIIVFRKPGEDRNLIKRCVGLPGEDIRLSGGEVYANDRILRKPLAVMDQFWRLYFRQSDFSGFRLARNWAAVGDWKCDVRGLHGTGPASLRYIPWQRELRGGKVVRATIRDIYPRLVTLGHMVCPNGHRFEPTVSDLYWEEDLDAGITRRGIMCPYDGARMPYDEPGFWENSSGEYDVSDIRFDLTFVPLSSSGSLVLSLAEGEGDSRTVRTLTIPLGLSDGRVEMNDGTGRIKRLVPMRPFLRGRAYTVTFENIDDRLVFKLDGRLVSVMEYEGPRDYVKGNEVSFSITEGARITVRAAAVWRDIFYCPRSTTYHVTPGHYFVLGDNSPNSSDSRVWGLVPEELLIGRAFLVFWPLSRFKYLRGGL